MGRLDELIPEARTPAYRLIAVAADQGAALRVGFVYRSFATQKALWMQKRFKLDLVNDQRKLVGLAPITAEENSRTVTRAKPGRSWHNWRRALDLIPIDQATAADLSDRDEPVWDVPYWPGLGAIGKHLGFGWGGDWKRPDRPHFQWSRGGNLNDLIACMPEGMS